MGDRETLVKIYSIMRRLLLVKMDGLNPIPRKGTTKRECYRALYEIQELLGTRRIFVSLPKQTNADLIRNMTDEELAEMLNHAQGDGYLVGIGQRKMSAYGNWLEWLKQEAT